MAARADEESVWHYYRDLIGLRRRHDVFVYGDYDLLLADHPAVFAHRRTLGSGRERERLVVACNFAGSEQRVSLPDSDGGPVDLLIGNYPEPGTPGSENGIGLRPYEARVYRRRTPTGD